MKEIIYGLLTIASVGINIQSLEQYKTEDLVVMSPAFKHEREIPVKYTCEGENIQPPLEIHNLPNKTESVAIVMYDEDGPGGHYVHWVAFNIEPKRVIDENSQPGITGKNAKGTNIYFGPCPPSGTHAYHIQVYALDKKLSLNADADERAIKKAMNRHIIGYGELIGRYKKMGLSDN